MTPEAVEELAAHVRTTGKPELREIQAFARLVRLGQVPTKGAVEGEMAALAATEARRQKLKGARRAVVEDLDGAGRSRPTWPRS